MSDNGISEKLRAYSERAAHLARSRATFDFPLAADMTLRSVRLAEGPARLGIVGIPSTVALCGPHQYLEFAKNFRDVRNLVALSVPGFVAGELLPANVRVAVEVEAAAVQGCMDGAPVVLIGYSSGGVFAYGVAHHLERMGAPVAAVVLIDAYSFQDGRDADVLLRRMFEDKELRRYLNNTRMTAMSWYTSLFTDWELAEVLAPTLLVQPKELMPGMQRDGDWKSTWPYPHDIVEVPGDHWTMMMEDAGSTAEAIERWISDLTEVDR